MPGENSVIATREKCTSGIEGTTSSERR